jgi:hypothetical protein
LFREVVAEELEFALGRSSDDSSEMLLSELGILSTAAPIIFSAMLTYSAILRTSIYILE